MLMSDELRQLVPGSDAYNKLWKMYHAQLKLELKAKILAREIRAAAREVRRGSKGKIDWESKPGFPKDAPREVQEAWKKAELKARHKEE